MPRPGLNRDKVERFARNQRFLCMFKARMKGMPRPGFEPGSQPFAGKICPERAE